MPTGHASEIVVEKRVRVSQGESQGECDLASQGESQDEYRANHKASQVTGGGDMSEVRDDQIDCGQGGV